MSHWTRYRFRFRNANIKILDSEENKTRMNTKPFMVLFVTYVS